MPARTDRPRPGRADDRDTDAVSAYKTFLRELIDRRPSGTRQRIAAALGTHKSFVTQITNPNYRVPLPAQHVSAIARVCHFSADEEAAFVRLYRAAHPAQPVSMPSAGEADILEIPLPPMRSAAEREQVADLIRDFAQRVIDLVRDDPRAGPHDPDTTGKAPRGEEIQ